MAVKWPHDLKVVLYDVVIRRHVYVFVCGLYVCMSVYVCTCMYVCGLYMYVCTFAHVHACDYVWAGIPLRSAGGRVKKHG